ncbi:MAG: type II toxin-antitoxin system HicB family antitoxin [Lachnospiraceae bacterium]|nr:type II toxin-antitoxin system HicB family antitoxin [Lachnospiraceae bacterium]
MKKEKINNSTKIAYPTFIEKNGKDYLVFVPDLDIYTEGKSLADAIEMARDSIGLKGITMEDDGLELPEPSSPEIALAKARKDADEIFDYSSGLLTFVDVDFYEYRLKNNNKMVRRNVTLPCWLNYEADKAQLNVSKVLQEALKNALGIPHLS